MAAARELLLFEAPDILLVQEALHHQLRDLRLILPHHRCIAGLASEGEHNAIFVDKRRYEVADSGAFWLSETPHKPESRDWGASKPRTATWAQLRTRDGSGVLTVVNTHFDHTSEKARIEAAKLLLSRFPDAVIGGDFNAEPETTPHDILTTSLRDLHPVDGAETMHGRDGTPDARYDWILVPYGVAASAPRVLRWRPADEAPSDHDAIAVDLEPRHADGRS